MSKTTNEFSPEVRERAVGLVLDNEGMRGSRRPRLIAASALASRPTWHRR